MLSSLRIIHPPSSDNPTNLPVLVLGIDGKRFIFNAPEGLTRVLIQRGARGAAKGLQGIFVPRVGNEECAGLPGMLMTLSDQGKDQLDLYGPPILSQLIASARTYTKRKGFRLNIHEAGLKDHAAKAGGAGQGSKEDSDVLFKDKDVTIKAIPLYPEGFQLSKREQNGVRPSKKLKRNDDDAHQMQSLGPSQHVRSCLSSMFEIGALTVNGSSNAIHTGEDPPANSSKNGQIASTYSKMDPPPLSPVTLQLNAGTGQAPVLMYMAEGSSVRGKFDARKAKMLGVPHERMYSILSSGQDIEFMRPKAWATWDEKTKLEHLASVKKKTFVTSKGAETDFEAQMKRSASIASGADEAELVKVRSEEVLASSIPGSAFIQVYLPSSDYLASFFAEETQAQINNLTNRLHVIVHAVHPSVLDDKRYQDFIRRHSSVNHFISTRPFLPDKLAYPSAALATLRMSHLDANLFKVPQYSLEPSRTLADVGLTTSNVRTVGMDIETSLHPRKEPRDYAREHPTFHPDFEWPLDSEEAGQVAAYCMPSLGGPHEDTLKRFKRRGQERWSKYLEVVGHLQEQESQRNSLGMAGVNTKESIKITTLGTGSASPSKYRNVSATLVHLPDDQGYILLDAGEGTYGQLSRHFGAQIDQVLGKIRLIFLSHIHGDHHMGTARLLHERKKLNLEEPLFVMIPRFARNYLLEVNDIQGLDICPPEQVATAKKGVILLENEHLDAFVGVKPFATSDMAASVGVQDEAWREKLEEQRSKKLSNLQEKGDDSASLPTVDEMVRMAAKDRKTARSQIKRLEDALHSTQVCTAEVDHRMKQCYGLVLRNADWSLAYSGDTKPCDTFAKAGRDVDVLVHEATFEDGEEVMAHRKGHSTVGQAIQVARRMHARKLLLTHFSQRYPKLPRIAETMADEEAGPEKTEDDDMGSMPVVGVSFDLTTFTLDDIGKTGRYREAMQILFEGAEAEEGEDSDAFGDDGLGQSVERVDKNDGQSGKKGSGKKQKKADDKDVRKPIAKDRRAQSVEKENAVDGHVDGKGSGKKQKTMANGDSLKSSDQGKEGEKSAEKSANEAKSSQDPNASSSSASSGVKPASQTKSESHNLAGQQKEITKQVKVVKSHEYSFVVVHLIPPRRQTEQDTHALPSRLAFNEALQRALEELHGLVGASFNRDIVLFDSLSKLSGAGEGDGPQSVCAVVRCPSLSVQTLVSAISTGFAVRTSGASSTFTSQHVGILNSLDLGSLRAMLTAPSSSNGKAGATIKPAGRAWMKSTTSSQGS